MAIDIFNPTPEHLQLREMVRAFTEKKVAPQALESDREERFNLSLFRELGELGLLGLTAPESVGGMAVSYTHLTLPTIYSV